MPLGNLPQRPAIPEAAGAARAENLPSLSSEELFALARLDAEAGRSEQALRKLKLLVAEPQPPLEALAMAGRIYAQLRLVEQAQSCYRRYLAARPDALHESFELGVLLFESGDLHGAGTQWGQLLARVPTYPPTLYYSALLAAREGRRTDALKHLEALLSAAAPDNVYVDRARELLTEVAPQPPG
jgi:tetratricopeptide (TPR) repeat protein